MKIKFKTTNEIFIGKGYCGKIRYNIKEKYLFTDACRSIYDKVMPYETIAINIENRINTLFYRDSMEDYLREKLI